MREIKFRAWNKTANNWWYGTLGDVLNLGSLADAIDEHFSFDGDSWQQFTGLKDKNGVEIYEGDIVRYTMDNEQFTMDVEYVFQDNLTGYDLTDEMELEVIGNIYENPELLKNE